MPESKYAARLRELGCKPAHETNSAADLDEVDEVVENVCRQIGLRPISAMSRKERRSLIAEGLLPNFVAFDTHVHINDETGVDWEGPVGIVDILKTELKFADLAGALEHLARGKPN